MLSFYMFLHMGPYKHFINTFSQSVLAKLQVLLFLICWVSWTVLKLPRFPWFDPYWAKPCWKSMHSRYYVVLWINSSWCLARCWWCRRRVVKIRRGLRHPPSVSGKFHLRCSGQRNRWETWHGHRGSHKEAETMAGQVQTVKTLAGKYTLIHSNQSKGCKFDLNTPNWRFPIKPNSCFSLWMSTGHLERQRSVWHKSMAVATHRVYVNLV